MTATVKTLTCKVPLTLYNDLEKYILVTKISKSDCIRESIQTYIEGNKKDTSISPLLLQRTIQFIQIVDSLIDDPQIKKEGEQLWQCLFQFLSALEAPPAD